MPDQRPVAIVNTSPLQYLHQCGLSDLFAKLYWEVLVPPAVVQELAAGRTLGFDLPDPTGFPWVRVVRPQSMATARADKITQAILAKAFRGELVPTEAELARQEGRDYEPASALLARIRAARAAGAPVERTGHVAAAGKSSRRKTSTRTARNR
ncbi:MAG TPA: hypothetical protein VJ860_23835 [Polyangia bacterium]|jgi:hypothetical protein|nr:hypothetical protein [Polyangia bacterium]